MANRGGFNRTEPLTTISAGIVMGVESRSSSTRPLDTPAMALEHVLASIARLEARMDASDRRGGAAQPPPGPDPDPPYAKWPRERVESGRHRPVWSTVTAVDSQQPVRVSEGPATQGAQFASQAGSASWDRPAQLGFAEGPSTRGLHLVFRHGASAWDRPGMAGDIHRDRPRSAWDNPSRRSDYRFERQAPGGDTTWERQEGPAYTDTPAQAKESVTEGLADEETVDTRETYHEEPERSIARDRSRRQKRQPRRLADSAKH
ncbi:hypothetical protein SASPL_128385 [Salvia splendens]|uniref:Uncharacterized protein n=1 Tax=Salvia splendens TaxID=180675 RepID=A0A8X8ZM14_SALSN|nr:hypothetical protein SASPL_128385 [Salvia splendens]